MFHCTKVKISTNKFVANIPGGDKKKKKRVRLVPSLLKKEKNNALLFFVAYVLPLKGRRVLVYLFLLLLGAAPKGNATEERDGWMGEFGLRRGGLFLLLFPPSCNAVPPREEEEESLLPLSPHSL